MTTAVRRRAVFLDRDGVLIKALVRGNLPYAAAKAEDIEIIDGVPAACRELSELGYLLVMTTNQPDVARGKISRAFVDETNAALARDLRLDDVQVCMHDNADNCDCRKPKPGLMLKAAEAFSIDLAASLVIGDRWRDIEAGQRAGCKTVFVDYGYGERLASAPDYVVPSLSAAVPLIRAHLNSEEVSQCHRN